MIKMIKISLILLLALSSTACGWLFGGDGMFRDRSNDYRQARETAPLKVPEGLNADAIDDSYDIPEISDRSELTDEYVMPRPEVLGEEVDREAVRISRLSDQQWILVNGAPGQVWPRLRGFLNLGRIGLLRADAVNGIIETVWIQPSEKGLTKERYRLRIEQGVQRGSSEVYILQMDISGGDKWPESSSNPERENLIVKELSQFLADTAIEGSVSMLAQQAIESSGRISIEQAEGSDPFIRLELPFYRAWASLGLAVEKGGYELDDLDVSQRIYYVRYVHPVAEEDEGWFSGWFSGWFTSDEDSDALPGIPYFIRVSEENTGLVTIKIEKQSGAPFNDGEATMLLKLIKRHIS